MLCMAVDWSGGGREKRSFDRLFFRSVTLAGLGEGTGRGRGRSESGSPVLVEPPVGLKRASWWEWGGGGGLKESGKGRSGLRGSSEKEWGSEV